MTRHQRLARSTRPRISRPPGKFLTPREYARLGACIVLLCAIVVGLQRVSKPSTWYGLTPSEQVDTRVWDDPTTPTIVGDSGRPQALAPPEPERKPSETDEGTLQVTGAEEPPATPPDEKAEQVNPLELLQIDECVELELDLMKELVRDKTTDRVEERELLWQALCVASTRPTEVLERQARRDVLFANLVNDPRLYRGTPIHLQGSLRRLIKHENKELKNAYGIAQYYEAWMFTADQPQHPTRLLFTRVPKELKPSEHLDDEIEVNAFFFKLHRYVDQEGKARLAPMLVGFEPRIVSYDIPTVPWPIVVGGGAIFVLAIAAIVFWQRAKDRRVEQSLRRPFSEESPPIEFDDAPSREEET